MPEPHYIEKGSGFPVLAIHGMQIDHTMMESCLEPIFLCHEGFRRIYVDLPGMGSSRSPLSSASADGILSILLDFIDSHIHSPFLLVGQSYGGYLSQGILNRRNGQVAGILLMAPVVIPDKGKRNVSHSPFHRTDEAFIRTLDEKERASFLNDMVLCDKKTYQRYRREIAEAIGRSDKPFIEELATHYSFSFAPATRYGGPALILTGRQDSCVGWKDQQELTALWSHCTSITLDEAGHNLQIDQEEAFGKIVSFWIERNEKKHEEGKGCYNHPILG